MESGTVGRRRRRSGKSGMPMGIIVGAVVVATLVLVGVLFFRGNDPEERNQERSATDKPTQSKPPTSTGAKEKPTSTVAPISGITWKQFDDVFGHSSETTDLQRTEAWKDYVGKKVKWKGTVAYVGEVKRQLTLHVRINPPHPKHPRLTHDVAVKLKDSEKQKALGLKKGNEVTFVGTLSGNCVRDRFVVVLALLKEGHIA